MTKTLYLTRPQFEAEISRCLNCKNRPCMKACPIGCNPQEFIKLAKDGDFEGAVNSIVSANPMGQTCGLICPDKFCMKSCTRSHIDFPVNIPKVQASIMHEHHNLPGSAPQAKSNGHKIAVIGAGPAGIAACTQLLKNNFAVTLFESTDHIGGALNLIPSNRLPVEVLNKEWSFVKQNPLLETRFNTKVTDINALLAQGFEHVIVASGEPNGIDLNVEGENLAVSYLDFLNHPQKYIATGNVAVIGGGAVAVDCAITAKQNGASFVEMFIRRRVSDMRITNDERQTLLDNGIDLTSMTKIKKISHQNSLLTLYTCKNRFTDGKLEEIPGTTVARPDFELVIKAIGSSAPHFDDTDKIIYAGDCKTGGSTAVEALASGKSAALSIISKYIKKAS